ncbi:energy-coupling factor transporter transmembrane protein EcfT [Corynebacterium sp. TAE3-ERU12]|uniref:energy-coupling factor transporter transmembrane component T family protein n=1 Tax=Corynebacterium sp. TAE3-ERU12 TaxID=2849491 RepID=UPI001C4929DE|nr:energy-coupling factor transporter transmembrane component T [Corynebacterium sp. TAE3-ERU12]MBV7295028.1 energy-coupling factor transporter transmembrane protein EcfT [Corynebacterium sp. TAE3-ERU12]
MSDFDLAAAAPGATRLDGTAEPDRTLIGRLNPVTRFVGLLVMGTPLLLTIDWLSALIAVVLTLTAAFICGVGLRRIARRGWQVLLAAPLSGISMLLYGEPGGKEYFSFLLAHVTENSVELAIAITLRVLAIGLPAVVFSINIDPTELGAGLSQLCKLPARFVIATTASVRMVTLFIDDWYALTRARRARGLGDTGLIRRLLNQVFALLVFALRRATKLATAMEARGFGAEGKRTWARQSHLRFADAVFFAYCVAVPVVALGLAMHFGTFRLIGMGG